MVPLIFGLFGTNKVPISHERQRSVQEDWVNLVPSSEKPVNLGRLFKSLQEQFMIGLYLKRDK